MKRSVIRKILSLSMALMFLFSMAVPTMAASVQANDLQGHWAEDVMEEWISLGLLSGRSEGRYYPNESITRAEFIALVNRLENFSQPSSEVSRFIDVNQSDWYYDAISVALGAGYISGTSENEMSPNTPITREQAITIISRLKNVSAGTAILAMAVDGSSVSDWAQASVAGAMQEGFVAGDAGRINPKANITRAETVALLDRVRTDSRVYAFAGTYGPANGMATLKGSVTIAAPGITLRNTAIGKSVTISPLVGEGDVHISNVTVKGDAYIQGGGKNSLYLADFRVEGSMIVRKYEGENVVRIVVTGDCNFSAVVLETGAIIVTQELADGTKLPIEIPANYLAGSTFEFIGNFDSIVNNGANTNIKITGNVNKLTLNGSANVSGSGRISVVDVSAEAGKGSAFETRPISIIGGGKDDVTLPPAAGGGGGGGGGGTSGGGSNPEPDPNPSPSYTVQSVDSLYQSVDHMSVYTLPITVSANLSGGSTKEFAVTWTPSDADTSNCGTFVFEGALTMTTGYTNPNNVKAILVLTVEPVLEDIVITQLPAKMLYYEGEALDIAGLSVSAQYSDGSLRVIDNTLLDINGFDAESIGLQLVTVTLGGFSDTFNVTVYALVENGTLLSIINPAPITVANGAAKTATGLNLPPRVEIEVEDEDTNVVYTLADVDWDVDSSSYDPEIKIEQNFNIDGTVMLPEGIDDDGLSLDIQIAVTVSVAKYTVSFNLNGQSGVGIAPQTVEYGSMAAEPTAPTSVSHDFVGWYDNADGSGAVWDFTVDVVTEDVTLYAAWTIKTYTITFDKGNADGSPVLPDSLSVEHGSVADKPEDPELAGFVFTGWFTDPALTIPYLWSTPVTSGFTLYAKFSDIFTQAFDALTFEIIRGGNANEQSILTNLTLPSSLLDFPGLSISWASSKPAVISAAGVVTRPASTEADEEVTLTATLTMGAKSEDKAFELIVRKQGVSNIEIIGADTRFAPGYPLVSYDASGKATLSIKLNPGTATVANPVYAYLVFEDLTYSGYTLTKESILYGHSIMINPTDGEYNVWNPSEIGELIITGDGVSTYITNWTLRQSATQNKIGVVLLKDDDIADPLAGATVIAMTLEEIGYIDITPPFLEAAFLSQTQNQIYLYFNETLSTAAQNKPAPGDFELIGAGGVTVTSVAIDNATNTSGIGLGRITLTLSGPTSGVTNLNYTSGTNKIADQNSNVVASTLSAAVKKEPPTVTAFINPTAGTMMLRFEPGLHYWTEYANFTSLSSSLVTLKRGGSPIGGFAFSNSMFSTDTSEAFYTFTPLPGGSYTTSDFTIDIASGFIFWNMQTIVVNAQNVGQIMPQITTVGITAAYDSGSNRINVTLPAGTEMSRSGTVSVACNFILKVDGVRLLYRSSAQRDYMSGDNVFYLPITGRIKDKIESGATITLEYQPDGHRKQTHTHINDISGAYLPAFGPVAVSK